MDLEILREFITLAEKLNFSETAKLHYITQPVLSKHIANLEKELGVSLFTRTRQNVALTQCGSSFLEDARCMVAQYEQALAKLRSLSGGHHTALNIAFLDAAVHTLLPEFTRAFLSKYPEADVNLHSVEIKEMTPLMEEKKCDIGITVDTGEFQTSDYQTLRIYEDPLCVVLPKDHRLSKRCSVRLEELSGERFIEAERNSFPAYNKLVNGLLRKAGVNTDSPRSSNSAEAAFLLMNAGLGIAIAPLHQSFFATDNQVLVPIENPGCKVDISLVWRRDNNNPWINRFATIVKKSL